MLNYDMIYLPPPLFSGPRGRSFTTILLPEGEEGRLVLPPLAKLPQISLG